MLFVICGLVGGGLALDYITLDIPIYTGALHADDSNRTAPGLRGVIVTLPEFIVKGSLTVVFLAATAWLWICLRRSDKVS